MIRDLKVTREDGRYARKERWSWTVGSDAYRTDAYGDSLYKWNGKKGDWVWMISSFSLRGMSVSGARKKLNRLFTEE